MRTTWFLALALVPAVLAVVPTAHAQLAVSANDNKVMLVTACPRSSPTRRRTP